MEKLVVQGRLVQGVNVEPQEREVNLVLMGYQDKKEAQEPLDLMVPRVNQVQLELLENQDHQAYRACQEREE